MLRSCALMKLTHDRASRGDGIDSKSWAFNLFPKPSIELSTGTRLITLKVTRCLEKGSLILNILTSFDFYNLTDKVFEGVAFILHPARTYASIARYWHIALFLHTFTLAYKRAGCKCNLTPHNWIWDLFR